MLLPFSNVLSRVSFDSGDIIRHHRAEGVLHHRVSYSNRCPSKLVIIGQLYEVGVLRPDMRIAHLGILRIGVIRLPARDLPPLRPVDPPGIIEVNVAVLSRFFGEVKAGVKPVW